VQPHLPRFDPVRRRPSRTHGLSLADAAYNSVREAILRGQLKPGVPLSRRRLASELRMSVIPVTDALRRLEEDGLVESRPRAGTRVRIPSRTDVRELYELREALESQSARLFAERATSRERDEVRQLAKHVDELFARLDHESDDTAFRFSVHTAHVQFHMRIAELAASGLVRQMIDRKHVLILNWMFDVVGRRTPLPQHFHASLAAALTSGNPVDADAAMREHVRYGLQEISARIGALAASEWRERRPPQRRKRAASGTA
jgi:GntR family transcriptional regulator, rspAB operon transcriptional repressor